MSKYKLSQLILGICKYHRHLEKKDVVFAFTCEYNSNFVGKGEGTEN